MASVSLRRGGGVLPLTLPPNPTPTRTLGLPQTLTLTLPHPYPTPKACSFFSLPLLWRAFSAAMVATRG